MERNRSPADRGKLFYGWIIVGVMAAAGAVSMALGTLNYGLFIKPMGDELGIGRSIFGWGQTVRQVASAVTGPIVGQLIDRFGSRVLLAVSALVTGAAILGLGFISHGWQLIGLLALAGVVGMSGQGALVTSVPVAKWFVRKRGKAMAFMSLGIPIGGVVFLPVTQILIERFGWRDAWIILGLLGVGIIVPLALLFVRRQPEDMGLLPDGAPGSIRVSAAHRESPASPQQEPGERSWTREEVLRSPSFWRLVVVFSVIMLAVSSTGVHRIPYFMDKEIDSRLVSYATAVDAAAAGVSMFLIGMLARRIPANVLGAVCFVLLGLAIFLTILANSAPLMFLATFMFGLGAGGMLLMQNYLWAEYFGRQYLGSIRGIVMPITLVFGGAGAPLAGYVRDATGSYTSIWVAGIGFALLGAAVLAFTPAPTSVHTAQQDAARTPQ